ncbi:MAG TPA: glycosyltransferase [Thermoanaerobaculia bacterium]|jgi:glycosyltransferase involved in cell wall biosynthesis
MKTAVVHDWLNGRRGGEKVLEAILPLVPDPTIFTLFHVPGSVSPAVERYPIRASFLNRLPFSRQHYRNYLPLFPRAVESFDLSGFDLVVSISHCVAKGAIAPPGVPHLCYCNSPVRWAYEMFDLYFPRDRTRFWRLKKAAIDRLRRWDIATAGRPTRLLGNSSVIVERIRRHWNRDSRALFPPVDVEYFTPSAERRGDFLLAVGALVPYKRFELAIEAARAVGRPLVLVGSGPEEARLRAMADSSVRMVSGIPGEELRQLFRTCAAFVQPGEEDFGIAAVEALACGAPIVALGRGGVRDMVRDGEHGLLYGEESAAGLAAALRRLESKSFDYNSLRASALQFSPERFAREFRDEVAALLPAAAGR